MSRSRRASKKLEEEKDEESLLTPELRFVILQEMRNMALPGKKYIQTKDIQRLFRKLGYEMSSFEKAKYLQSILFTPSEREITFEDLFLIFNKKLKEDITPLRELSECFKIISDEQGFNQHDFSSLMMECCGEHMKDEILEMVRMNPLDENGKVNTDYFVEKYTDLTPKKDD